MSRGRWCGCRAETRLLICGQAPGRRVHESGLPFDDPSGDRLRGWMGVDRETFYGHPAIGVAAMAFCYPGTEPQGRRLSAAAALRGALARAAAGRPAEGRADPAGRRLRPGLGAGRRRPALDDRDGARLARLPARHAAAAAPLLAQHRLAEAQSLVRGRGGALSAPARVGRSSADEAPSLAPSCSGLAGLARLRADACSRPLPPEPASPARGWRTHAFVSFDGARLGLTPLGRRRPASPGR